jgi:hypothetical protein
MDLFDPDSGNQEHDMMPGILPNGLFWTMQIPRDSFVTYGGGQEARLVLRNLPLVETFQIFGPLAIPAQLDVDVRWQATGEFVERGEGAAADPTSPGAFKGNFAEAECTGWAHGIETGFSFDTGKLTATDFYAQLGEEQNGSFLS